MTEKRIQGTFFRWVVPQLSPEIWDVKQTFKSQILDRLWSSKTAKKGLKFYSIAVESHADGNPHLDMLIIFEKRIKLTYTELDFLVQKHGQLTRYRNLNAAILNYGSKQDTPLSNLPNPQLLLDHELLRKCPVSYLMKIVDQDPFRFNFLQYCHVNNYFNMIQRWTYVKNKIKDYQQTTCNLHLKSKPGFTYIDRTLIQTHLTLDQLRSYDAWSGYQIIVDYLNQILTHGWERPVTSRQLYISGRTRIGKSNLIRTLSKYTSTYPVGTQNWFPKFENFTYKLMSWDQPDFSMMSMQQMLQLFDGDPFNLPYKGGSILKRDNQLWIMCSNKTLQQQLISSGYSTIKQASGRYKDQQINALTNRVKQVRLPAGYTLDIVRKLVTKIECGFEAR